MPASDAEIFEDMYAKARAFLDDGTGGYKVAVHIVGSDVTLGSGGGPSAGASLEVTQLQVRDAVQAMAAAPSLPAGISLDATLVQIRDALLATAPYLPPVPVVSGSNVPFTAATPIAMTAIETHAVAAGAGADVIGLHRFSLSVYGATTLTWKTGATTLWAKRFPSAGDWEVDFSQYPWIWTVAGETLNLSSSAAVYVDGIAHFHRGA